MDTPTSTGGVLWKHGSSEISGHPYEQRCKPLAPGVQPSDPSSILINSTRGLWHFLTSPHLFYYPIHDLDVFFLFRILLFIPTNTLVLTFSAPTLPSHLRLFAPLNHLFPPCPHIQMVLPCFCNLHSQMRIPGLGSKCPILDLYIVPN